MALNEQQIEAELETLRQLVMELSRTVEQQGAMLAQFTKILEQYSDLLRRLAIVVAQDHPDLAASGNPNGAQD